MEGVRSVDKVGRAGEVLRGIVGTYTRAGAIAAGEGVAVAVAAGERLLDVLTTVERDHQAVCDWTIIRMPNYRAGGADSHRRPSKDDVKSRLVGAQKYAEGTDRGRR